MTIDTKDLRAKVSKRPRVADLLGQTFGRLIALARVENDKHHNAQWKCLCVCGTECVVRAMSLRSGDTKSCGCWQREHTKHIDTAQHGHSRRKGKTRTYQSWIAMVRRCVNPKDKRYYRYGGRGITVCERWLKFENFLADMGECPPDLTIERIDNDGNYEPSNCKWATWAEQRLNKSRRDCCRKGHKYPADVRVDAKGARVCRVCVADNARTRRAA